MTNPTPGWYPDPQVPQQMRWWDGQCWSPDTYQRVEPLEDWTAAPAANRTLSTASTVGERTGPTTPDGVPLAGWWQRAVARVLDTVFTSLLTCVIGFRPLAAAVEAFLDQVRAGVRASQAGQQVAYVQDPATVRALAVLSLIWLALTLAYDLVFLLRRGATPGKLLMGLRVRRWDPDQPLTPPRIGVRWLTSSGLSSLGIGGLGLIYGLADALVPLWHPRRQCLHDRFARTCVVQAPRPEDARSSR